MAAARDLATYLWPVFPVCNKGEDKKPVGEGWREKASRAVNGDPDWLRATGVGVLPARETFFVLDVDRKAGKRGTETLAAWEKEHGPLPKTWTVVTGTGGWHYYFKHPGFTVRGTRSVIGEHIDVIGEEGSPWFAVAPPSIHPNGNTYQWAPGLSPKEVGLAEAPVWLLEMVQRSSAPRLSVVAPPPEPRRDRRPDRMSLIERGRRYAALCPPAISGEHGHDTAWAAIINIIRGLGLAEDEGRESVSDWNARCVPPWNEKELRHKIYDAINVATVPPWEYLLDAPPRRQHGAAASSARQAEREEPGCDDGDPTPAIKPPRFVMEKLSDLLAEVIPPTKWLLAPYVPACSFGELVGPPGKGKTTFMAWMLMQMASAGYRCAVIEEEGSRRGLQRLLSRAMEAVGSNVSERIGFMHSQHVNLLNALDVHELSVVLKGFDFVLFDSFSLVTPGLDEDKAKDGGPVIKDLLWLRDTLKIAPWFNHHSGKSKWKSGEVPHLGDGRGSSIWPGALDTELSMRPVEDAETGFIQFDLFVTKMREGDDQVKPQRVSIARNGPAAIVQMYDTDAEVAPPVDGHLLLEVLNFITAAGQAGTSKNQIEKNVVGKTDSIRAALLALKYSSRVEEIPAGQYTKWRIL